MWKVAGYNSALTGFALHGPRLKFTVLEIVNLFPPYYLVPSLTIFTSFNVTFHKTAPPWFFPLFLLRFVLCFMADLCRLSLLTHVIIDDYKPIECILFLFEYE